MSSEVAVEMHGGRWKLYPAYRDSGVEWLGKVPEGWKVRKLKHIASVKFSSVDKKTEDGEHPVCLCNYVDVYYNDYITPDLDLMKATASVAEIQNFTLREGDILITKDSESWDDIAVPAYVSSYFNNVLCGYHLAQIRPNMSITDGEYLFRSFYARGINDQFRVAATGVTRYGLGKYWLDNSLFLMPPLPEQRAIAAFLYRETGRIDTLIEKKGRQVELLQEKRAALISHAVTKGLDPDVKMKESGVEWLEEVPENWNVRKFNHIADNISVGFVGSIEKHYTDETGVLLLKTGNIGQNKLLLNDVSYVTREFHDSNVKSQLSSGDIIIARHGDSGKSAVIPDNISEANCLNVVKLKKSNLMNGDFYTYLLNSNKYQQFLNASQGGSVQGVINTSDIIELKVVLPPHEEQGAIVAFLDRETERIDTLTTKIRESISKLSEYRTALISAVVTGKIDVRQEIA